MPRRCCTSTTAIATASFLSGLSTTCPAHLVISSKPSLSQASIYLVHLISNEHQVLLFTESQPISHDCVGFIESRI
jgi:hypothetical protein